MIRLQNVRITFPDFQLFIENQQLSDRITGVFGPSGSGKTTLLEIVAGIRHPDSGCIEVDDRILIDTTKRISVPVEKRRIGYVPQDLALFPHLSVTENLMFGVHGKPEKKEFDHIVDLLEIKTLLARGISNLSGGEKQRVAFARAILASPSLLMLDEPLASLDRSLKDRSIEYLLKISRDLTCPMIYVSHEREEIVRLCTSVLVLEEGRVIHFGKPSEIL